MAVGTTEYSSNNSGGSWWLTDEEWFALEKAGWKVQWYKDQPAGIMRREGEERFLGALASGATREGLSLGDAIREFEDVTFQNSSDLGCYSCCGPPHSFTFTGPAGEYDSYSPDAPMYGDRYESW